jgi:preprotein translocase subunit SecA
MRDYYDILNIRKDASSLEIKKAYFSLVRKYSPERYPEEFKEIREAYEILIDEKTRKEYDSVNLMPDIVKLYFDKSKEALEEGDADQAIKLLERVNKIYPDLTVIKSLLGDAYLENENSVKAIQIFEELVWQEPQNAGYAGKLAHAYLNRGWHRKAVDKYLNALKLDKDNIGLWLGLVDCYMKAEDYAKVRETAMNALALGRTKDWDNSIFYLRLLELDIIEEKPEELKKHLEEMKVLVLQDEERREIVAWILGYISSVLSAKGHMEEALLVINTAHEMDPDNELVETGLAEIERESLLQSELDKLKNDKSIHNDLKEMLEFSLIGKCKEEYCIDCELEEFAYEMHILEDIGMFKSSILKLRNKYPELYNIKEEFFYNILNPVRYRSMIYKYKKRMERYIRTMPEKFFGDNSEYDDEYDKWDYEDDDYDEMEYKQEPYRRTEPKVGRNDPCPCGSGKKYKKCCGKDA